MKKIIIFLIAILFPLSVLASEKDVVLPKVPATIGMDVIQAMESRAGARSYDDQRAVPMEVVSNKPPCPTGNMVP